MHINSQAIEQVTSFQCLEVALSQNRLEPTSLHHWVLSWIFLVAVFHTYMKCISPILTVLSRTQTRAKCFYKRFMSVFYVYFKLIYVNHSFTVPFPSGHTHFSVYKVNAWMQHKDCAESGPFWISFCICLGPGIRLIGFGNLSRHVLSGMSEIDSISQREVCNTMD